MFDIYLSINAKVYLNKLLVMVREVVSSTILVLAYSVGRTFMARDGSKKFCIMHMSAPFDSIESKMERATERTNHPP